MKIKVKWEEVWGYLIIIVASSFWGSAASLGKRLMLQGVSTFALMQVRSVITSSILLIALLLFSRRHLRVTRKDLPGLFLLAIPGLALVNASYYYAIRVLPVAIAVFIQFTAPVLIFLYSLLRKKETISAPKVLALISCMAGTFFMVRLQGSGTANLPWIGLVCAVISMITYAFYIFHSHNLGKTLSPWTMNFYGYAIASLFWCLVVNGADTARQLSQHHLWGQAALFAVCSTLIPFSLFLVGLRRVSPTGASIVSTSETVAATLFAFLFLGESLTTGQIVGAVFILGAILILLLHRPEAAPEVV